MAQKKGTQGQGLKLGQWVKMSVNGYDFYEEKSDHQIWHLGREFKHKFGDRNSNKPTFRSSNAKGGMLKFKC